MDDDGDERLRQKGYLPGQVAPEEAAELLRRNARDEAERRSRAPPAEWRPDYVEARLVEAFGVLSALPGATRPKQFGSAWPTWTYTRADMQGQGEQARREFFRERNRVRFTPSAAEITRANEAAQWCWKYLDGAPELARAVNLSVFWAARRTTVQDGCWRERIAVRTFYRRRLLGLTTITERLVIGRVPVR